MRCIILSFMLGVFLLNFCITFAQNPQSAVATTLLVKQSLKYSAENCKDVKIRVYVPQEDEFQKIISLKASEQFIKVRDAYGNTLLEFHPEKKKGEIKIKTVVRVFRREVKALDPYEFEEVADIAKWVYENLKYDESFANVVLSPEDILRKKRGTCDEFSTLMIYFLRKKGMNASYEIGYACEESTFRAHGWVRVSKNGKNIDFDPTWCEYPVDALHVKLASLPSAFFNESEVRAKCYSGGKISISQQNVEIKVLNISYSSLLEENFRFMEEKAKYNFYTLATLELFSNSCVLTSTNFGKCVDEDGKSILEPYIFPECVYFCGKKRVFAIFKVYNASYEAKCKISAKTPIGELTSGEIILEKGDGEKVWLNVNKNVVNKCETVLLTSNGHIFALEDFYAFKKGYFRVCKNTTIYALKDSLTESKIIVKDFGKKMEERKKENAIFNNTLTKRFPQKEQKGTNKTEETNGKKKKSLIDLIIEFFKSLLFFLI